MEYSYITGLSLIFPLKVSRALVSVCLLGHVSVSQEVRLVCTLPSLCTYTHVCTGQVHLVINQHVTFSVPDLSRSLLYLHLIILWMQIILGAWGWTDLQQWRIPEARWLLKCGQEPWGPRVTRGVLTQVTRTSSPWVMQTMNQLDPALSS